MTIEWIEKRVYRGSSEPELRLTSNYLMLNRSALKNIEGDHVRVGASGGKIYVASGTADDGYKLSRGSASRKIQLASLVEAVQEKGAKKGVYKGVWQEAHKAWEFSWEAPIVPRGRHVVEGEAKLAVENVEAEVKKAEAKPAAKAPRRTTKAKAKQEETVAS